MISRLIKMEALRFVKEEKLKTLADINDGYCADFALEICHKIKGAKFVKGPGHCWIAYDGKLYDAEHPRGVSNPLRLNFYKRDWRERRNLRRVLR